MVEPKIVSQHQFASLDDFIKNNNNFYARLVVDSACTKIGRDDWPVYERFNHDFPELAAELREKMTMLNYRDAMGSDETWREIFPWDKLWEAYKIMSNLVYLDDPEVKGENDSDFLTR